MTATRTASYADDEFVLIFADEQDHIARQVGSTGTFYEFELLRALEPLISPGDVVLDVGANIGNHTIFFAGVTGARVVAVEPIELARKCLLASITANGFQDRIGVLPFALGAKASRATVGTIDQNNLGATRLHPSDDGLVEVKTLDSVRDSLHHQIRVIKVDVEGMELDVLLGARDTLRTDRPVVVCECQSVANLSAVSRELQTYGYRMAEVFNATPTYVFLPEPQSDVDRAQKAAYLEEALVRSHQRVRALSDSLSDLRNRLDKSDRRIRALERNDNAEASTTESTK